MEKEQATAKPATRTPFYSKTVDDQTFNFRRPGIDELDRFMLKMSRGPTAAARDFTGKLIASEDRSAWQALTEDQPGLMTEAAQEILEKLSFR